jgi:hypothetical protein
MTETTTVSIPSTALLALAGFMFLASVGLALVTPGAGNGNIVAAFGYALPMPVFMTAFTYPLRKTRNPNGRRIAFCFGAVVTMVLCLVHHLAP